MSAQPLLLAPVRLLLGLGAFGAALLGGVERGRAVAGLLFGAGVLVFAALADPRRRFRRPPREPVAAPPSARYEPWWAMVASGVFPSTLGVTILAAIALPLDPRVTAVLGGVLVGMALAGLAVGAQLAWWEREHGVRLFVERGDASRLYAGEPPSGSDPASQVCRE